MPTYSDLPGPKALPLIGVGPAFALKGCEYLCELTSRYGRMVKFPLPGIRGVLVSDKELIKKVLLQSERQFYKGTLYNFIKPVVGLGLVTNQGPAWRLRRKLLNPLFQPETLSEHRLEQATAPALAKLCNKIEQSIAMNEALDTTDAMMELTFSILIGLFFGQVPVQGYSKLASAFKEVQTWIGNRFVSVVRPPRSLPTPANLRLKSAMKTLEDFVEHMKTFTNKAPSDSFNLLATLMQAQDPATGGKLTRKDILDEIITFLIAGHDTTALTLSYTLALLAEHPEHLDTILHELHSPLKTSPRDETELHHRPYLEQVLAESMRLYPAVYMINRTNKEPFTYGGYDFQAQTTFFVSQLATHRDPDYWPDPLTFDPARFLRGVPDDYRYFPFAGGPRTCIGNHLAMSEAILVLKKLLPLFKPVKLETAFRMTPQLTSIPQPGIALRWQKTV